MTKAEWDALRYPIVIRQCSEEEGGGWCAYIPLLGEGAFANDGETAQEAIDNLEMLRRDLYEMVITSGKSIPLPAEREDGGATLNEGRATHTDQCLLF